MSGIVATGVQLSFFVADDVVVMVLSVGDVRLKSEVDCFRVSNSSCGHGITTKNMGSLLKIARV